MKNRKRTSRVINFIAFNILFFALYLNFIHKDSNNVAAANPGAEGSNQTVLVSNPDAYLDAAGANDHATAQPEFRYH